MPKTVFYNPKENSYITVMGVEDLDKEVVRVPTGTFDENKQEIMEERFLTEEEKTARLLDIEAAINKFSSDPSIQRLE